MGTTWRLLLKELSAFGIVGAACFVLDVALFQLLYAHPHLGRSPPRPFSTLVSMTVAYFAHRYWSFSAPRAHRLRREYLLFAVVNGVTLLLSRRGRFVRYPLGQESALVLQLANVAT